MSLFGRTPELLGDFNSRIPASKSTFSIPLTHTYFSLFLHMQMTLADGVTPIVMTAANVATYVKSIKLKVNSNTTYELLGSQIAFYFASKNYSMADNVIPIYLTLPDQRTAAAEDVSGYGTANINDFDIEVELVAGTHIIDRFELSAIRGQNTDLGPHLTLDNFARESTGAGRVNLVGFTDEGQRIHALYMDTTVLDEIQLKANSDLVYETVNAEIRAAVSAMYKRSQSTGTVIELNTSKRMSDMLEVAGRDVRMICEASAADTFNLMVEGTKIIPGLPTSRPLNPAVV